MNYFYFALMLMALYFIGQAFKIGGALKGYHINLFKREIRRL